MTEFSMKYENWPWKSGKSPIPRGTWLWLWVSPEKSCLHHGPCLRYLSRAKLQDASQGTKVHHGKTFGISCTYWRCMCIYIYTYIYIYTFLFIYLIIGNYNCILYMIYYIRYAYIHTVCIQYIYCIYIYIYSIYIYTVYIYSIYTVYTQYIYTVYIQYIHSIYTVYIYSIYIYTVYIHYIYILYIIIVSYCLHISVRHLNRIVIQPILHLCWAGLESWLKVVSCLSWQKKTDIM